MENGEQRLYPENNAIEPYRTEYRRDYARVIHSSAFRRLQNKTQLFPSQESDFFRNRMTHSLEVAQIAKTIAFKLLLDVPGLDIEPDVCEIAGLVHDLGHPPFGHNGEDALNSCMRTHGGFEGNAQTLRIIARLEKKTADPRYHKEFRDEQRYGLNLTARTIASVLKYDTLIPGDYDDDAVKKGYYASEGDVAYNVKNILVGDMYHGKFKTIECQIMDLADDIAYSTYDLEDAFRAGFLSPLEMLSVDDSIFEQIAQKLRNSDINVTKEECKIVLFDLFSTTWSDITDELKSLDKRRKNYGKQVLSKLIDIHKLSSAFASNGYMRTDFTSHLIKIFMDGIKVKINNDYPILSEVSLDSNTKLQVNVLKHFAYVCLINSARLKVADHRGAEIVTSIFKALCSNKGIKLMTEDAQRIIEKGNVFKQRAVCDYIAGMTDKYALEFSSRLFSTNPQSIFSPFLN
jgi:dGTPase